MARGDSAVVERAHDFQRTESADIPVEISPVRDGINVRAEEKHRQIFVAGAAAKDVSGGVHAHGQARLAYELREPGARGEIGFGKADARDAAVKPGAGGAAELGEFFQRGPQALLIDVSDRRLRLSGKPHQQQERRHRKQRAAVHEGIDP